MVWRARLHVTNDPQLRLVLILGMQGVEKRTHSEQKQNDAHQRGGPNQWACTGLIAEAHGRIGLGIQKMTEVYKTSSQVGGLDSG